LWGHEETIAQRFERDREKLLPLPAAPYEECQKRTTRASSQALVRFETNDYSVPVAYGHHQVLVKAFVWEVVISCSSEVIARHARSYGREEMIFDALHYLALLEQKTNALDQAAPLVGWQLPEEFTELRRQMEALLVLGERRKGTVHRDSSCRSRGGEWHNFERCRRGPGAASARGSLAVDADPWFGLRRHGERAGQHERLVCSEQQYSCHRRAWQELWRNRRGVLDA
jgi:hypothetical protein